MADVTTATPGAFCWPELSTIDQKGAVAFYRGLFGWDLNEQPMGPGETYSMFTVRGRLAAAAYSMRPEERSMHVPPHWNNYVSVTSADDSAKKAESLGAKILMPAFDVMDSGRMAFIQDPTGAVFAVWQPKKHIGVQVAGEPGALVWTELLTRDAAAAERFYAALFGWTLKHSTNPNMQYTEIHNQGTPQGGIMAITPQMGPMPSAWWPYFGVDDTDKAAAKVKELGGKVVMGPQDIEKVGRFAVVGDPQGAMFNIFKGNM
jgi:uncharacterized protein